MFLGMDIATVRSQTLGKYQAAFSTSIKKIDLGAKIQKERKRTNSGWSSTKGGGGVQAVCS
jgi:hypothetical protein